MRRQDEKIKAIILISTNPAISPPHITEKLKDIDGVENIFEVTGQYDIATLISRETINLVNNGINEIRSITGVLNTNTLIILRTCI
jgi:Lrp/AsnC family transcriptional regulator of lysine biosynthesis